MKKVRQLFGEGNSDLIKLETYIQESEDFQLELYGGGRIMSNQAIMVGDKLMVKLQREIMKQQEDAKIKAALNPKRPRYNGSKNQKLIHNSQNMSQGSSQRVSSQIGAFVDPDSTMDGDDKFVDVSSRKMIKQEFVRQEKALPKKEKCDPKQYNCVKFVLKKLDYEHLRAKVLSNAISEHHELLDFINNEWAGPLGFSMKMKRPPKINKMGKSVRFYCSQFNNNQTEEDCDEIHNETGLREEYCYFGLSFKQVPLESKKNKHKKEGLWILNTDYSADRMFHNHPFFYSYSTAEQILGTIYTAGEESKMMDLQQDPLTNLTTGFEDTGITNGFEDEPSELPKNETEFVVNQYFRQYKETIKNFSKIDHVLKNKEAGKIKPSKRYFDSHSKNQPAQQMFDKNGFPLQDMSDYEGNAQGDEELIRQKQYDKKAFITYLQEHKAHFKLQIKSKAANSIENMYYQSEEMYKNYAMYQDVVFINRKIYKTRFNRKFILFQGVDNEGKTTVFGVSVAKDEQICDYKYAIDQFYDSIKSVASPKVMIIERNSSIRKAFNELDIENKYGTKLQYCYYHLSKSLKSQVRNMIQTNSFQEDIKEILLKVEKLPLIESYHGLMSELDSCKHLVNNCQEILKGHPTIYQLMNKIYEERKYWGRCNQTRERTLRVNAYGRNDSMKSWLQQAILQPNSGVSVEDAISLMTNFEWLKQKQYIRIEEDKNQNHSSIRQEIQKYGAKDVVLTYDEYRFTFSIIADKEYIMHAFLRPQLTSSAFERCKFNMIQGLKYWRILEADGASKIYKVQFFNPNQAIADPVADAKKLVFVKSVDGYAVCSCMERFSIGLPCMHEFHVGLRRNLNILFSERWFKEYPLKFKNHVNAKDLVRQINEQEQNEQIYAYQALSIKSQQKEFQISEKDIQIQPLEKKKVSVQNFQFARSFLLERGKRVFKTGERRTEIKWEELNDDHTITDAQLFGNNTQNSEIKPNQLRSKLLEKAQLMPQSMLKKRGRPSSSTEKSPMRPLAKPKNYYVPVQKVRPMTANDILNQKTPPKKHVNNNEHFKCVDRTLSVNYDAQKEKRLQELKEKLEKIKNGPSSKPIEEDIQSSYKPEKDEVIKQIVKEFKPVSDQIRMEVQKERNVYKPKAPAPVVEEPPAEEKEKKTKKEKKPKEEKKKPREEKKAQKDSVPKQEIKKEPTPIIQQKKVVEAPAPLAAKLKTPVQQGSGKASLTKKPMGGLGAMLKKVTYQSAQTLNKFKS